jgi:hypothetical protein
VQGAGNPVHEVPGLTPRLPVKTVGPVFVTVWAPSTAKVTADPRGGLLAASAVCVDAENTSSGSNNSNSNRGPAVGGMYFLNLTARLADGFSMTTSYFSL